MPPISSIILTTTAALASAQTTAIPIDVFSSDSLFTEYFSYNYPWSGDVHNGGARMSSSLCALSSNTLIQTAIYDHSEPDVEDLAINYRSCTMYANQDFVVEPNGSLDFEAEFIAPVAMGTWPAFWLSAMERWPPEIDMAEWKGSGMTSFNTFNASDQVDALDMEYPNLAYGEGKVERSRGVNVSRDLPDLNRWKGGDFRFRRSSPSMMWMEQTTQMEGSSGSPGSLTDTTFSMRNLEVTSYNPRRVE